MSRPWMPLYIADYRADTAHLNAAQHGAYLLLIMHYWQTGALPQDDAPLARIACMTPAEWRKARPIIAPFFQDGWKHKRIDGELARASEISSKRRASAELMHSKRHANAEQLDTHARASPPSPSQEDAAGAALEEIPGVPKPPTLEKQLFERGKQVAGQSAGGLIAKVLKAKNGDVALARAAVEVASTKQDPREYLGAVAGGNEPASQNWLKAVL